MSSLLRTRRTALCGAVAAGALAAAIGPVTPPADAAFSLGACEGSATAGRGASFAAALHNAGFFGANFNTAGGCNGTPPNPTYNVATPELGGASPSGSGSGLGSCGAGGSGYPQGYRSTTVRFCATDDPATATQRARINAGDPGTTADDGQIHHLPIAGGANVVIVHLPEGCVLPSPTDASGPVTGYAGDTSGDAAADNTTRPLLSNGTIENIFARDASARFWGQVIPGLTGTVAANADAGDDRWAGRSCAATDDTAPATADKGVPITRIVRQDGSGTTYNQKSFLSLVSGGLGGAWMEPTSLTSGANGNNTVWPAAGDFSSTVDTNATKADSGNLCANVTTFICGGKTSGNDDLTLAVAKTNGSIGYSDVATARSTPLSGPSKPQQDFELTETASATDRDYTFWLPIQNMPSSGSPVYVEPTNDPTAHLHTGTNPVGNKGANCGSLPALRGIPAGDAAPSGIETLGDWSQAIATGGSGYPICVLTYGLVWDDNAAVYGTGAGEEAQARTVKDYFTFIASPFGQSLIGTDYSSLSPQVRALLQEGVSSVDWNKSAGTTNNNTNQPPANQTPTTQTPTTQTPTTQTPVVPSNAFTLAGVRAKGRNIQLSVTLPGAGRLEVVSALVIGKRTIPFATVVRDLAGGSGRVMLKAARAALKRIAKTPNKKRLKVNVQVTFTPTGGSPAAKTATVQVKGTKKPRKKKRS